MSLFGSFLHDQSEDPFFGGPNHLMNQVNSMMNSMLQNPFLNVMPTQHQHMLQSNGLNVHPQQQGAMMPFGGMAMGMGMGMGGMANPFGMQSMFQTVSQNGSFMGPTPMYSSSSIMSMTTGPDGTPQVYQASTTTRTGAGGVREVQQTVNDSRSGVRKMAIGRHLGERGHVIEKEQNYRTGDTEEREDFINIEEEEAAYFDDEWNQRVQRSENHHGRPRIEMGHSQSRASAAPLAIAAGPSQDHQDHHRNRVYHQRGVGPDRNARRRDHHRSGRSRHETPM